MSALLRKIGEITCSSPCGDGGEIDFFSKNISCSTIDTVPSRQDSGFGDAEVEIHVESVREINHDGNPSCVGNMNDFVNMNEDFHCSSKEEYGVSLLTNLDNPVSNDGYGLAKDAGAATGDKTSFMVNQGFEERIILDIIEVNCKGKAGTIVPKCQRATQQWDVEPGDIKFNVHLSGWRCHETTEYVDLNLNLSSEGDWEFENENELEYVYKATIQNSTFHLILSRQYFVRMPESMEWKQHLMTSDYPRLTKGLDNGKRQVITLRFAKFCGDVFYDPVVKEINMSVGPFQFHMQRKVSTRENGRMDQVSTTMKLSKGESFNVSKEKKILLRNGQVSKETKKIRVRIREWLKFSSRRIQGTSSRRIQGTGTMGGIDSSATMPIMSESSLFEYDEFQFDAFLSHTWAFDEDGRDNHLRVKAMQEALERRGLRVWIDYNNLRGRDIRNSMAHGIENSKKVIVFITLKYIEKVAGEGPNGSNDNCKHEFDHAYNHRGAENMIPVVMERACSSQDTWHGQVGMVHGPQMHYSFKTDEELEECAANLVKVIRESEAMDEQLL